mmetsp:Transcript_11875/g.20091  ORF Transcript_11875/g.20091 Transcript_11875/m.20091 type:complete len:90 (+) Transcript_11875:1403-1672(+)
MLYLMFFQFGIGGIVFSHAAEVCVDSSVGFANQVIFCWVVITSILTPILIENTGTVGAFSFFGACSVLCLVFMHCFLRDTTYGYKVEMK